MEPGMIVGASTFSWPQTCVSCCTCIPHQTFPRWSAGTRRKVGQACSEKARNIFRICLFTRCSAYHLAGKTLSFHFCPYPVSRIFFSVENYIQQVKNYFQACGSKKKSVSIWMLHLFFKMYILSLEHECSTVPVYPLLNKYKEYRLADVIRACRCFLHWISC